MNQIGNLMAPVRFETRRDRGTSIFSVAMLDRFEKLLLILVFSVLCYRMFNAFRASGNVMHLLFVLDQLAIVLFVLFRRPAEALTQKLSDWLIAVAGTFLPMAMVSVSVENALLPAAGSMFIWLCGFLLHLAAKLSLGRSFGVVAANRGTKASGVYRFVRHPMYAGYMLAHLGFVLAGPNATNFGLMIVTWTLFVLRIGAEERVLQEDEKYRTLMQQTPYRLVPGIY